MPIFKVTTEADCEGRSMKTLGYIEAFSPEHAVKSLYNSGISCYYAYNVTLVANPVTVATDIHKLEHLTTEFKGKFASSSSFTVKHKESPEERKAKLEDKVKQSGLSIKEMEEYLKGNTAR